MSSSQKIKIVKPTVFVSFNNKDSKFVDSLEHEASKNATVIRYEDGVSSWGSFVEFMQTIKQQDFAVLVISEQYLKSSACLYEVLELMCKKDWRDKTMFVIMNNNIDIYKAEGRVEYIKYWNDICVQLTKEIAALPETSTYGLKEDLASALKARDNIDAFLRTVADTKNPPLYHVIPEIRKKLEVEHSNIIGEMVASEEVSNGIWRKTPNQQRVIRMLFPKNRVTCQEVAADLGISFNAARYTLERLVQKGIVERVNIKKFVYYNIAL